MVQESELIPAKPKGFKRPAALNLGSSKGMKNYKGKDYEEDH